MESVIVAICCFVFLIIITFVFFSKPKMNKLENKTFSWLLVLNIIGLILQVLSYALINKYDNFQNTIYYIIIIRMIFFGTGVFGIGGIFIAFLNIINTIISLVLCAFAIYGIVNAVQGKCKKLPIIGKFDILGKFMK